MSHPNPNDGSRPSRLLLARYHTGELEPDEAAALEAQLPAHPEARAYLAELDAARLAVPKLDLAALKRSVTPEEAPAPPPIPVPANRPRWAVLGALAAVAVAALVALPLLQAPSGDPTLPVGPTPAPSVLVRGERALMVHHLQGDALRAYDGSPLAQGETIGLSVRPGGASGVVVISIDGDGQASVLYPAEGNEPEPLGGDGRSTPLPGTLILDDAPGPETLLAVFDRDVDDVLLEAADRYDEDGIEGLLDWAQADPDVDASVLQRAESEPTP